MTGDKIYIADKTTLDKVDTTTTNTSSKVDSIDSVAQAINTNIGDPNNTGGSTTAGTLFAKLNAALTTLASILSRVNSIPTSSNTYTPTSVTIPIGGSATLPRKTDLVNSIVHYSVNYYAYNSNSSEGIAVWGSSYIPLQISSITSTNIVVKNLSDLSITLYYGYWS